MEERKILLDRIDKANERLKQLKMQGVSSKDKRLKNIRKRRNINIKILIKILSPETNYYDLMEERICSSEWKMIQKKIKGKIVIVFGMDNFCYIHAKNGKRVDLTEWMKKFNGKDVELNVKIQSK